MARSRPNTTTSTQPGETRRGYRPFERGYQPVDNAQVSQNEQSTQNLPKPPTGGTGQTPPRATRPRERETRPE